MTLTTFQSLFLSVMLIVAAALIAGGCGLPGTEHGYSPLWENQRNTAH